MSKQLISHSPDLQRLRDEGYNVTIRADYLVIDGIPYVNAAGKVDYGALASELTTSGDRTTTPGSHQVFFIGSIPYDHQGNALGNLISQQGDIQLGDSLVASCAFSRKPAAGYPDYYEKITTYALMLEGYARAIDDTATSRSFRPVAADADESVFRYLDSASSRARIGAVTEKLRVPKVAIVGLGGTGGYILDLIAKAPSGEIHLYDGDKFYTHNAFRAPGAARLDELEQAPAKVEYFRGKYDAMRRAIFAHPYHVDDSNIDELRNSSFVFLSIDGSPTKRFIVERLEEFGVPFVDTGMGVYQTGTALAGIVRSTTSLDDERDHLARHVSFADAEADEYEQNIQIADLNMLNAALAVIKWKKLCGFYVDLERELSSYYTIDGNHLLNEDQVA